MPEFVEQEDYCLNCKTTLRGDYCHRCGQKKINTNHDSFLKMMSHFIGDFVHFDSQIFRTAIPLLFKPGFLVNEYLSGKRARYLSPIRMYVFLSFLFFFLTFSLTKYNSDVNTSGSESEPTTNFQMKDGSARTTKNMIWSELSDSLSNMNDSSIIKFDKNDAFTSLFQYDSIQNTFSSDRKDNWIKHQFIVKGLILKDKILSKDRDIFIKEVFNDFMHNFPKILFFLLPVFAFLFKVLYRKRYYGVHFIFSITFYNFFFLFGSLILIIQSIPFLSVEETSIYILIPLIYLYIAMLNVYEETKLKTFFKLGIFAFMFCILLGLGMFANILFTLWSV